MTWMTKSKAAATLAVAVVAVAAMSWVLADVATPRPRWTTVRMQSETVDIALGEKRVAVEAVFHMYNEGKAGKVRMGYPLGAFEDELHDFKAYAGGREIKDVRTQEGAGKSSRRPRGGLGRGRGADGPAAERYRFEGPYKKWKVFDVPMAAHEAKTVKVTYWVAPARITDADKGPLLHYTYTLRTGATWKGKIDEAVIRVKLDGVEPTRIVRRAPVGAATSAGGKVLTWTMKDFKPVDNIEITYRPTKTTETAMRSGGH